MLTLVGDPAMFLVGSSIGMNFVQYLQKVSFGGLLSVLVLVPLLPWVMREVWQVKRTLPADLPLKPLERPFFCAMELLVLMLMILLFLYGDSLPFQLVHPSVAIKRAVTLFSCHYQSICGIKSNDSGA